MNTRISDAVREAVAKAIADVIGHGMREKCSAHADAALTAALPLLGDMGNPVSGDAGQEPVGYFDPDVLAHLTEGSIDPAGILRRKPNGTSNVAVWLAPPAQAVAPSQSSGGGEPAFYLSASDWGHIRIPMTKHRDVRALRHGFDHGDVKLVPFYAAPQPPAQAVDLGQFRPAVCAMGLYAEDPEDADEAKRLLALIDSQAAGGEPNTAPNRLTVQTVDLGQQAKRYEWLRDSYDPSVHDDEGGSLLRLSGDKLDTAIDGWIDSQEVANG